MLVSVCGYVCNVNSVRKLCVCMGMCVNSWGFEQRWNLRGFEPRWRWNHPQRAECCGTGFVNICSVGRCRCSRNPCHSIPPAEDFDLPKSSPARIFRPARILRTVMGVHRFEASFDTTKTVPRASQALRHYKYSTPSVQFRRGFGPRRGFCEPLWFASMAPVEDPVLSICERLGLASFMRRPNCCCPRKISLFETLYFFGSMFFGFRPSHNGLQISRRGPKPLRAIGAECTVFVVRERLRCSGYCICSVFGRAECTVFVVSQCLRPSVLFL